jgi:exocyst complex component 6
MCQVAMNVTSRALGEVSNAEDILKIKGFIALFIQTMEVKSKCHFHGPYIDQIQGWGYSVSMLDNFLLTLFDKYADLLKRRFSDDFQEVRL